MAYQKGHFPFQGYSFASIGLKNNIAQEYHEYHILEFKKFVDEPGSYKDTHPFASLDPFYRLNSEQLDEFYQNKINKVSDGGYRFVNLIKKYIQVCREIFNDPKVKDFNLFTLIALALVGEGKATLEKYNNPNAQRLLILFYRFFYNGPFCSKAKEVFLNHFIESLPFKIRDKITKCFSYSECSQLITTERLKPLTKFLYGNNSLLKKSALAFLKKHLVPSKYSKSRISTFDAKTGEKVQIFQNNKNDLGFILSLYISIFDMHTLAAYRAACARFGSTTTIELPDDTLNRKAAQSAADIAFQLESGALDPAHFGDYDDMVPPNQVLVHVLVQPDRSRPDNLNQIEQAVLQYLGESDHIKALFTPGYLGLSAISKCLIYGKQEMVKGLIALVKQKGIQPSQLSSHVVAAIKFCREQPSSEYEELDIHKNLAANLSCLEKPPILIIPTQTTGLNLTEAKHLILFNQPKSLAVRDQVMARIDRIGQTEPISFYSFKPETDVDQWLHSICNLQKEALDILINPKAFYVMASQDDKASKTTELISTFFVAKAIFELIAQNMEEKDSESTDVDDLKTENIKRLKKMDFKSFLIQFRVFVRTKKLIETHRKEDPVPTGVSKPPEPKSSHAESNPGILDGLRLLADGAEDLDFFAAGGELFGDLDSAWEDTFNPDGTFNWDGLGAL